MTFSCRINYSYIYHYAWHFIPIILGSLLRPKEWCVDSGHILIVMTTEILSITQKNGKAGENYSYVE